MGERLSDLVGDVTALSSYINTPPQLCDKNEEVHQHRRETKGSMKLWSKIKAVPTGGEVVFLGGGQIGMERQPVSSKILRSSWMGNNDIACAPLS